jgi:sugar-specific transcriptional regulator TrmB
MLKELQDLGLTEKEAKVYIASLEVGRATADQLAKHAKLVRPTTYLQIKALMEMGLMSTYEEGKKTYFSPEAPSALTRLLEKRKQELSANEELLSRIIPDLTREYEGAGERPVVRFFPGKEGITALRNLALTSKTKKHSFIYSYEGLSGLYSYDERKAYTEKRVEEGIEVRAIVSSEEETMTSGFSLTQLLPVSSKELPIHTDLLVWDNNVNVVLYKGNPFGVLIQSEEVAKSFLATFNLLWKLLAEKNEIK